MRQQLAQLREAMKKHGVQWVYVPTDDFHGSEYVGDYFKCRKFLTGFTGSAGTALVGMNWAGLWTDGRYFLQAGQQLADSGFELMKMGKPGVPRITEYLKDHLQAGETLAFDGRTVSASTWKQMDEICRQKEAKLECQLDLVGEIWNDRPAMSTEPVFELSETYTGKSRAEKLAKTREKLLEAKADALVTTSLMDICWLLNIRGNDVACTPVVLSYLILTQREACLFIHDQVLSPEIRSHLTEDGVSLYPYEAIVEHVRRLPENSRVMMNLFNTNCAIYRSVPESVTVLDQPEPTILLKAVKNPTEVANFREAHVKDGVAVTRLMYWLKKNVGKIPMDELSVAEQLEEYRKEQPNYLGPSFDPIIAWGPHGAIIHYSATKESNVPVEPRSFLLADTGGHYLEGTTDITRTFAVGPLTQEEREMYTRVLLGHLHLGAACFRYGCTGVNLDYLAHEPLWQINMDYNHGTGHGVGYVLAVHEGPQGFRWHATNLSKVPVLEPGMITSDEPGVYLEGKFGIRLENLTVVCDGVTNEYGRFLHLEYLTMVPFDLDAIVTEMLSPRDKELLNAYHQMVREKVGPGLKDPEERAWLEEATRPI